ncbi:MAG TPA: BatA and WFA domain-containing protein [Candidatus Dormibacteraeota bacterium]|nr:BatA and WFA domain-containing protein [Candidatus Dormibacteraeota bacterium]
MGLFAPWFLAGLAALAVPFYVHLLRRHTTTPRPFSSLMFFERRTQSSIKHRRLRYLLLLSLRALLLLLLVLAFTNPFINRSAADMSGQKLMLLVIDHSFSMRAGTRLADARREALAVLASRKPADRAQVMALGSQLQALTQPSQDAGALRAAVENLQPGDSRASYAELARAVRAMAETIQTPIELHFFSDMQKSAMPASFSELALPANVSLILHPVAQGAAPNWTVESVNAPGQVWDPKKSRVQAVVAGFGTPAATRAVSLVVNGKTIATKNVEVPAGGSATAEFDSLAVPYGFTRCAVRIDSADAFPADDVSLFAVERSDPRSALFVSDAGDSRSPLYFRSALASAAESAFTLETVSAGQAAGLPLSKYAFVVLSDLISVPASMESDLLRYVRAGGSVWILEGASAAQSARVPVFGGNVLGSHYYSRTSDQFLNVGDADPSYPSVENTGRFAGVKFYFAVRVDPGDARVIARLTDQTPLLLEKKIGEGRVLLFASGLDNITNDFPLQPIFVPFVEQTALYLSGTQRRSGARTVDSFLDLRSSTQQSGSGGADIGVEVIDPDGRRPLSLKQAASERTFQLTRAGFYQIKLANGRREVVGVNPDRRESNLETVPADTLALWRGNSGTGAQQAAAGQATTEHTQPYSLWWYIMLLVFAAAIAESLLADRYLGAQEQEDV